MRTCAGASLRGGARVSRAAFGVAQKRTLLWIPYRLEPKTHEDFAIARGARQTPDACATLFQRVGL
ncbi:MAG: hypothetical protein DME99_00265 [Verrucomicrobia bacterium]|nr:MAG: hypothetical protein DME99_00265 [Verrucomicrobiota bacterium]